MIFKLKNCSILTAVTALRMHWDTWSATSWVQRVFQVSHHTLTPWADQALTCVTAASGHSTTLLFHNHLEALSAAPVVVQMAVLLNGPHMPCHRYCRESSWWILFWPQCACQPCLHHCPKRPWSTTFSPILPPCDPSKKLSIRLRQAFLRQNDNIWYKNCCIVCWKPVFCQDPPSAVSLVQQ